MERIGIRENTIVTSSKKCIKTYPLLSLIDNAREEKKRKVTPRKIAFPNHRKKGEWKG